MKKYIKTLFSTKLDFSKILNKNLQKIIKKDFLNMPIKKHSLFIFILVVMSLPLSAFTQTTDDKKTTEATEEKKIPAKPIHHPPRKLGDIFLGFRTVGGPGYTFQNNQFEQNKTSIKDHNLYFYSIGLQGEFYLASFFSLLTTYDIQLKRFQRTTTYPNGSDTVKESKYFQQWFNSFNIDARFLFAEMFYLQTGPSLIANYNSGFFKRMSGIDTNINTTPGVSLRWQAGLGFEPIIGYDKKGDPLLSLDLGLYAYIPIIGLTVDNKDKNSGGTSVAIEEKTYDFEFSFALTFLI